MVSPDDVEELHYWARATTGEFKEAYYEIASHNEFDYENSFAFGVHHAETAALRLIDLL